MVDPIVKNTKDWPIELQSHIDFIAGRDNQPGLSTNDVLGAQSYYCDPQKADVPHMLKEILCPLSSDLIPSKALRDFFKLRFGFSLFNPIHRLVELEAEVVRDERETEVLEAVYQTLRNIFEAVKKKLKPGMTPHEKLKLTYQTIWDHKLQIRQECVPSLFASDVYRSSLDCDSSSFIVAAIADELQWPVFLVPLPGHVFIRWDDGQVKLNMDFGHKVADHHYLEKFGVADLDKRKIRFNQADFLFYSNRGNIRLEITGGLTNALGDFNQAIRLVSSKDSLPELYNGRSNAYMVLGRKEEALRDINRAIQLAPNDGNYYLTLGIVYANFGQNKEAISSLDKAIEFSKYLGSEKLARAYFLRGEARLKLEGVSDRALDDLAQSYVLDEKYKKEAHRLVLEARRKGIGGCGCSLGSAP